MFVAESAVESWQAVYGKPHLWTWQQPISVPDFAIITSSQKHGRRHDITLYIEGDRQIAVIAKPFYPPGLYRAPSGGLDPGEGLEDGATREALEETGLRIQLVRYLLQVRVTFECETGRVEWITHVFTAATRDRVLAPTDRHEIREARWADPSEFEHFCSLKRMTGRGGLLYRAALHEEVARYHTLFAPR